MLRSAVSLTVSGVLVVQPLFDNSRRRRDETPPRA